MSGDINYGKCQCCGKKAPLTRTYFYYDIECECCGCKHNGKNIHFQFIEHCNTCIPKKPDTINVHLKADKYYIG